MRGALAALAPTLAPTLARTLALAALALALAAPAWAQDEGGGPAEEEAVVEAVAPEEDAAWAEAAARAEAMAEAGRGSAFALGRLRAELVGWRDAFATAQARNAARIATVEAQVAALGAPPAEGEAAEDERVAARRAELAGELARLRAPGALAEEAYVRADGLIGELDALARGRQAAALLDRMAPPLDPRGWPEAWRAVTTRSTGLWKELRVSVRSESRLATLGRTWPFALMLLVVAGVLLARGRAWLSMGSARVQAGWRAGRHGQAAWRFLMSLGHLGLPLLGLVALREALDATGLFGARAGALIAVIPVAGAAVLAPRLLGAHFFAASRTGPVPFDWTAEERARGRVLVRRIGWALAAGIVLRAFLSAGEAGLEVRATLRLPIDAALALLLFRLGQLLAAARPAGPPESDQALFRRRLLRLAGRAVMGVAAVAPALLLVGFHRAGGALLMPAVLTLGLLALVMLMQWLVTDLYAVLTRREDGIRDALSPVIAGFLLGALALPVLALIWGARAEDLLELWTRFREGFSIGETRLSPEVVVTFAVVFGVGYVVTRAVQGTLRSTVLPKTRMDLGAQNALVAGVGYLGLVLAALLAITTAGLDLSNLAIVAGALSVGIGFGLQAVVSNFVAGIILLIERPISEGDWIEVGGRMGYVRDISVRSTRIETFDRTDVIVPNADLVSGQVVNWTRGNSVGRIILPVSVAYDSDHEQVATILREAAEAHPLVLLKPPPSVVLMGFGADALNFEIRAIIRDVNLGIATRSEINHVVARRFAEAGIRTAGTPAPPQPPPKPAAAVA